MTSELQQATPSPGADGALSDVVSRQYQRWAYPHPIEDLEAWVRDRHEYFDPVVSHRVLWPDRDYSPNLDILIAGCGTNQAAVFAFNNRSARVVGIDVSETSLAHEQRLKDKHGLSNLELLRLPIEEIATLQRDFDLIVSTGVLHHMADPLRGMHALGSCLRRDGVIAVMLYARYGRAGIEALQSVFRDLGLSQEELSVQLVKDTLEHLHSEHLAQTYLRIAPDLHSDPGLVDTFLHGRERSYTVDDCIDLVTSAGLAFQGWLDNACYYPETIMSDQCPLYARLKTLPDPKVWSIIERLHTQNACHRFIACRTDRPHLQYTIDFSSAGFLDYVPVPRHGFQPEGNEIEHMGTRVPLNEIQLAFLLQVDGRATIKDIAASVSVEGMVGDASERQKYARELFQSLWRLGFIAIALQTS